MEEKTKQRFIGVIVIIGALFIILPFLFHNSRPSLQTNLSANAPNSNVTVALPTAATSSANITTTANTNVIDNNSASAIQTQPSNTTNNNIATQNKSTDANAASTTAQTQTSNNIATTTTPQATDMTTQAAPTTSTPATTSDSLAPASPNALTTGNANEGPTQPTQTIPATQNTVTSTTTLPNKSATAPTKHVIKKHVAIKKQEITRLPINTSASAWEIQVAVFSDKSNAEKMIAKLRAHHFEAYSRRVVVNRRHYIAIFVGPEINFARAEILQKDLRRDFRLSGEIKKYQGLMG